MLENSLTMNFQCFQKWGEQDNCMGLVNGMYYRSCVSVTVFDVDCSGVTQWLQIMVVLTFEILTSVVLCLIKSCLSMCC